MFNMGMGVNERTAGLLFGVGDSNGAQARRRIVSRTRGRGDAIVRLMSPSDLGQVVKPFVFLDIFDMDQRALRAAATCGYSITIRRSRVVAASGLFNLPE